MDIERWKAHCAASDNSGSGRWVKGAVLSGPSCARALRKLKMPAQDFAPAQAAPGFGAKSLQFSLYYR
jgi:hypothetical protein